MNQHVDWRFWSLILAIVPLPLSVDATEKSGAASEFQNGKSADETSGDGSPDSQQTVSIAAHPNCEMVVTWQPTRLYSHDRGVRRTVRTMPPCTVLELVPGATTTIYIGEPCWPVLDPVDPKSFRFVPKAHVFNIDEMRKRVLAASINDDGRMGPGISTKIPRVVAVSDVRIIKAWKAIAPLASHNISLPQEQRSPEPHFALAQLWTAVGSHADALEELLHGAEQIRSQKKGDLLEYAKYFTILEESLNQVAKQPGQPLVSEANKYWGFGMNDFRIGRFDRAVFNFTDAVRLAPSDPVYWYSRALTYRKLGLSEQAVRDVRIGVTIEHQPQSEKWHVGPRLEEIQGPDRTWLEDFRKGDGISWQRF